MPICAEPVLATVAVLARSSVGREVREIADSALTAHKGGAELYPMIWAPRPVAWGSPRGKATSQMGSSGPMSSGSAR